MRNLALYFLVCAPLLNAQILSFGVKGGGLFTEAAERFDESRRYVVGPSVEIGFPYRIALEIDALYSRFGSSASASNNPGFNDSRIRGHMLEFPVLGKYYFADREAAVRPYASSGFAFRNIWFDNGRSGRNDRRFTSDFAAGTEPAIGAVVSGGVAFGLGPLKLAPELRYTRWGGYNFPATNPNELQGLLGIRF
jgi:hypothetical protein